MAKFFTLLLLIVGLMVMFSVTNFIDGGVVNQIKVLSIEGLADFRTLDFYKIFLDNILLLAGTATGIAIGLIFKASPTDILSAIIASTILGGFIGDLILIFQKVNETGNFTGIVILFFAAPLVVAYVISMWDWIRGRD